MQYRAVMIRPPAVAGTFYPSDARELARQIDGLRAAPPAAREIVARGCVVPHAGYMYSGHVAGAVYSALEIPARCILLGPRHFPRGEAMAILLQGSLRRRWAKHNRFGARRGACRSVRVCEKMRWRTSANIRSRCRFRFCSGLRGIFGLCRWCWGRIVTRDGRAWARRGESRGGAERACARDRELGHEPLRERCDYAREGRGAITRILGLDPRGLYDTVRREQFRCAATRRRWRCWSPYANSARARRCWCGMRPQATSTATASAWSAMQGLCGERRRIFAAVVAQIGTAIDCRRDTDGALKCAATKARAAAGIIRIS